MTIPLPTVDNDGIPFPEADVGWFERALLNLTSGYRKHLWARGAWDGDEGVCEEPIAVYVSTVEAARLADVLELLGRVREVFRQAAVYVETAPVRRLLLAASTATGDAGVSGGVSVSRH